MSGDEPKPEPPEPEQRKCARCGGPWDLPPADTAIPFCTKCLYAKREQR